MKIVVVVNAVPAERVSVTAGKLDFGEAAMLGPASRAALYLALAVSDEVTVLATGELAAAEDALREALAYGAQRAILIAASDQRGATDYAARAAAVKSALEQVESDLIICAAGSHTLARGSYAPTGPLLAGMLGRPYIGGVESLARAGDLEVTAREGDELLTYAVPGGTQVVLGVSNPAPAAHELPWFGGFVNAYHGGEVERVAAAGEGKLTLSQIGPAPKRESHELLTDPPAESAAVLVESLRTRSLI